MNLGSPSSREGLPPYWAGVRGHTKKPQPLQSLGVATNRRCSPEGQKESRTAEGMSLLSPTSQKLGCRTLWRKERKIILKKAVTIFFRLLVHLKSFHFPKIDSAP